MPRLIRPRGFKVFKYDWLHISPVSLFPKSPKLIILTLTTHISPKLVPKEYSFFRVGLFDRVYLDILTKDYHRQVHKTRLPEKQRGVVMKKLYCIVGLVFLLNAVSYSIGFQHGVFRSQSTQGTQWQGTATIESEHFDITVFPDYLDVELEWVFKVGGTAPDSFKNALEIVGNFNLDQNATIVGMITWYEGKVLKGKLKTDTVARAQYEKVVDRSSECPPPPRDPVLIEYGWGPDNYYISIFPASFDGTRKVRLRYLVPAYNVNGVNKIVYPYAFEPNATVSIKKGPGVESYLIETDLSKDRFDNPQPIVLDNSKYSLEAYGTTACKRIAYIIPVLSGANNGSVIYSGAFSTPTFSGEVSHVTLMSAERALTNASVAQDYVILWRWNHPQILAKYGRQIVEQSSLLKKFLSTLESANKRAALIIDKEGGETITFHLDKAGGVVFNRMIDYLDSLGKQTVIDPPVSSTNKTVDIQCDAAKELKEFNDAIAAAMDLFEKDAKSLKHLLILTAGPQLVSLIQATPSVTLDQNIDMGLLSTFMNSEEIETVTSTNQLYWSGVSISTFMQKYQNAFSVSATVGNGKDTSGIDVLKFSSTGPSYSNGTRTTEMHLYSDRPLTKEIKWSILKGDSLLATFTETPRTVVLDDGMQYGRLIGSSQYLVPLADKMPSSIASTLGFVDEKYALVALEEDSLPGAVGSTYESYGVPLLDPSDLFPSPDERSDVPVSEWLVANPPTPMNQSANSWGVIGGGDKFIAFDSAIPNARVADNVPARIGPQSPTIYNLDPSGYVDYSGALAVKEPLRRDKTTVLKAIPFNVKNGSLEIELSKLGISGGEGVRVTLFDCAGRLMGVWNCVSGGNRLTINLNSFAHGAYMLRITSKSLGSVQKLVVR